MSCQVPASQPVLGHAHGHHIQALLHGARLRGNCPGNSIELEMWGHATRRKRRHGGLRLYYAVGYRVVVGIEGAKGCLVKQTPT